MSGLKINLLPQEIKKKRVAEKGLVLILGILALVIGFCVLTTAILYMQAGVEAKNLDAKKAQVSAVEKEIAKYGIYKDRQMAVKNHKLSLDETLKNEVYWHRFLNEMSMVVPDDIAVSSMKLDETGVVEIDGACYEYATVAEYLVRLNDLSMIENVWLQKIESVELESVQIVGEESTTGSGKTVMGLNFLILANLKNPVINAAPNTKTGAQGTTPSSNNNTSSQGSGTGST